MATTRSFARRILLYSAALRREARARSPVIHDPGARPYFGLLTRPVQTARLRAAARWLSSPGRLLDVGCGLTDLPARVASYVGCDRNPDVLDRCRARHPNAAFHSWDVASSGPPPEVVAASPYDTVLLLAVLEHLADPGRALARVAPLLAPRGRVVTTTPHPLGRLPLELGARLGLLSRHADEEHDTLLARPRLEAAGRTAGLSLADYRRFLLGLNQLAVFERT